MGSNEPLRRIGACLRAGCPLGDVAFDAPYPKCVRRVSARFWTSVGIARRAAAMLCLAGAKRILDVGSGAGKFCIVGSLGWPAEFWGVEHRPYLVRIAQSYARRVGARARFVCGTPDSMDLGAFDGLYLFNPFGENLGRVGDPLDGIVELSRERCVRDVRCIEEALERAAPGMGVVTYHGFGGSFPRGYERVRLDDGGESDPLCLWVKGTPDFARDLSDRADRKTLRHASGGTR